MRLTKISDNLPLNTLFNHKQGGMSSASKIWSDLAPQVSLKRHLIYLRLVVLVALLRHTARFLSQPQMIGCGSGRRGGEQQFTILILY